MKFTVMSKNRFGDYELQGPAGGKFCVFLDPEFADIGDTLTLSVTTKAAPKTFVEKTKAAVKNVKDSFKSE